MHNLLHLYTPREINQFISELWQTDIFRASHKDPYGYVNHWVSRFAQTPRIYFEMDKPEIEHSHFTPWFNALHFREYPNPAIHDLFHFHEMVHMTTLTYDPNVSFEDWTAKMIENEQRTALESEVMIYHELPGLRSQSFDFEIWADRFLPLPMKSRSEIYQLRRAAVISPQDDIERSMSHYPSQNQDWANIWRHNWRTVERQMWRFNWALETNPRQALDNLSRWLVEETGATPERPYAFPDKAEQFATLFRRNRQVANNLLLSSVKC